MTRSETEPLRVLDWAGFRAAASYTFDDANSSQIEHYDHLQALGVPLTFYLSTAKPESESRIWARALDDGHELGNHGHHHREGGSVADLLDDVDRASALIEERFGVSAWSLAAPFGSLDYVPVARRRFFTNRGVQSGFVLPEGLSDPWYLDCFVPRQAATSSDFNARVEAARALGGWEIVVLHGFEGGDDRAYRPVAFEQFRGAVEQAKAHGDVWIGTLLDVAAYWLGQRTVARAAQRLHSRGLTYRWTLPRHFPPGKFVRVVSAGRGLTQAGRALLPVRGYYDVALDEGELTVLL